MKPQSRHKANRQEEGREWKNERQHQYQTDKLNVWCGVSFKQILKLTIITVLSDLKLKLKVNYCGYKFILNYNFTFKIQSTLSIFESQTLLQN